MFMKINETYMCKRKRNLHTLFSRKRKRKRERENGSLNILCKNSFNIKEIRRKEEQFHRHKNSHMVSWEITLHKYYEDIYLFR